MREPPPFQFSHSVVAHRGEHVAKSRQIALIHHRYARSSPTSCREDIQNQRGAHKACVEVLVIVVLDDLHGAREDRRFHFRRDQSERQREDVGPLAAIDVLPLAAS
ncbi:MAG: hypothetical protein QM757_40655 [Paludibaculum sp.]